MYVGLNQSMVLYPSKSQWMLSRCLVLLFALLFADCGAAPGLVSHRLQSRLFAAQRKQGCGQVQKLKMNI